MPRPDLVLWWLTAIWLFSGPDRCSADQASYLGVTPGRTTQEQLLASSEWGRPARHIRAPRGWSELEYDFANGLQATVVVHDRSVLTVDLRPARPLTSREAVRQFELGDLIPCHTLPVAALFGPAVSRRWVFNRCAAGAIVFAEQQDGKEKVELIRLFAVDAPEQPAAPGEVGSRERPRLGINVRAVDRQLARQIGGQPGKGVLITAVQPNAAASRIGLRVGDVLVEYDGVAIRNPAQLVDVLQQRGIYGRHSIELLRDGQHVLADVNLDRPAGGQPAPPPRPPAGDGPVDLPPPITRPADTRRVVTFFGVQPGTTSKAQLLDNARWETPVDGELATDALSHLQFSVNNYEVHVAVWCNTVQTIDIVMPAGVRVAQIVAGFRLGNRLSDATIPRQAAVGATVDPGWEARQYDDARAILYVDTQTGAPQVKLLRLFGREPTYDELMRRLPPRPQQPPATPPAAALPESITNSLGMRLQLIPGGAFQMGGRESAEQLERAFGPLSERNRNCWPLHRVVISRPFYLATHEVTYAQFRSFVDRTGYRTEAERGVSGDRARGNTLSRLAQEPNATWRRNSSTQTQQDPVTYVTWNDAQAFCRWLSKQDSATYRLPTEAEWEYACRAGTRTRYYSGDNFESLVQIANTLDAAARQQTPQWTNGVRGNDGYAFLAPVGRFRPNAFGLYDMHGNVWEWVADWYAADYYSRSPETDPRGPASGQRRIIRGGCWY